MRRNSPLTGCPSICERHLLREVALGDGADDARDLGGRLHQVADERVDGTDAASPAAAHLVQGRTFGHAAFAADDALDAHHLVGHRLVERDDRVELVRDVGHQRAGRGASPAAERQAHAEIALPYRAQGVQELGQRCVFEGTRANRAAARLDRGRGCNGRRGGGRFRRGVATVLSVASAVSARWSGCASVEIHEGTSSAPNAGRSYEWLRFEAGGCFGQRTDQAFLRPCPFPLPFTESREDPPGGVERRAADAAARSAARRSTSPRRKSRRPLTVRRAGSRPLSESTRTESGESPSTRAASLGVSRSLGSEAVGSFSTGSRPVSWNVMSWSGNHRTPKRKGE